MQQLALEEYYTQDIDCQKWVRTLLKHSPVSAPHGTPTRTPKNPQSKPTVEPAEPGVQQQHHTTPFANTLLCSLESLLCIYPFGSFSMSTRGSPAATATQPPKAPPLILKNTTSSIATRKQTVNSSSLSTGHSKQDIMSAPACSSSIYTTPSACKYLVKHSLLQQNQDPDNNSLSYALLHLTFAPGVTAPTADAIRLIAILIDTMLPHPSTPSPETTPPLTHPTLLEQINKLTASVQEIKEVADINKSSAEALTRTIDVSKEEMHMAAQLVTDAAEALTTMLPTHPQSDDDDDHTLAKRPQPTSYAAAVKHSPHTREVTCCTAQARTIHLTPPSDDTGSSLAELSEEVLVQKANLALDLACEHGSPTPTEAQFISAWKTANKNVLYEVDLEETVTWLRSPEGQHLFASKFSAEVSLASRPFSVLIEYIQITLEVDNLNVHRDIERRNNLPAGSNQSKGSPRLNAVPTP